MVCATGRKSLNGLLQDLVIMQILIAEDDFISRRLLQSVLEELGHEVIAAEDGETAWRLFERTPTRLVISDWLMPKLDGIQLVKRIREAALSDYTYIILLTANVGQRENYLRAMDAGVDDFLAKPLDRIELSIRLRVAERILKASSRIRSLESVLTICAYTKRVNFPEEGWQTLETFMQNHLGITLSHGIDPEYYERVLKPQIEELRQPGGSASKLPTTG